MNARQYPRKENVDDIALNHFCVHLGLRPNDSLQRPVECRSHREAVAKTPCLNPTGLYDPTKHKSILAVTYHLNRNQNSIFNAAVPCPRTAPTEHGTTTKHNLQRMNARPYPQKKDVDNIVLNASLHPLQNRNFTSIFNVQRPFRAKGLQGAPQNRNITSVFDVQRPFRAKGLRRTPQNRNFT